MAAAWCTSTASWSSFPWKSVIIELIFGTAISADFEIIRGCENSHQAAVHPEKSFETGRSTSVFFSHHFSTKLCLKMQECMVVLSLSILLHFAPWATGQGPCPEPDVIIPCTCSYDESEIRAAVDCSEATSSEDIFSVFNDVSWPFLDFTWDL